MTVEERVKALRRQIKEQEEQRDWLLKVEWRDCQGDAQRAAVDIEQIIGVYEKLIRRLEGNEG